MRTLKKMTMIDYPTQLDEIDQWLFDSFGILPGACSSTENLRYNTARMIAEVLWPKCKDSLHIPETCKENGKSFTDVEKAARKAYPSKENVLVTAFGKLSFDAHRSEREAFIAGAEWQKKQTVRRNKKTKIM